MSKVDALRAMREAKYARSGAPPQPAGAAAPRTAKALTRTAPKGPSPTADATETGIGNDTDTDELCGHRNMGGKSCSRPAGHSEKNHRYATA